MKIAVAGLGYVGLSISILLAKHNKVVGLDTSVEKVYMLNNKLSPIADRGIERALSDDVLDFCATTSPEEAFSDVDFVIIATPTDYAPERNFFDTSSIEQILSLVVQIVPEAVIVIRSTAPVGFTERMRKLFKTERILFSPEFLREGKALFDNRNPSRIIVGGHPEHAKAFACLLLDGAENKDVPVLLTGSSEAEAIKLFSNTYLAMRVAFFNELDSYAVAQNLNTREIIKGVCLDPRIGDFYNNPSYGYGGYCLPKDTKQLLANYQGIPQNLMGAVIKANKTRKDFVADMIASKNPKTVGVYRLVMKQGADNFRNSAVLDILDRLVDKGIPCLIYEPLLRSSHFRNAEVVTDLTTFKKRSFLIVANRWDSSLDDVSDKVFSRDIFFRD